MTVILLDHVSLTAGKNRISTMRYVSSCDLRSSDYEETEEDHMTKVSHTYNIQTLMSTLMEQCSDY